MFCFCGGVACRVEYDSLPCAFECFSEDGAEPGGHGLVGFVLRARDRSVMAAFVSIGIGAPASSNVLERLTEHGTIRDRDQRTVRRWSDDGMLRLAELVVARVAPQFTSIWLLLFQTNDDTVGLEVLHQRPRPVEEPHQELWSANGPMPQVWVGDDEVPLSWTEEDRPEDPVAITFKAAALTLPLGDGYSRLSLDAAWAGGLTASWRICSGLSLPNVALIDTTPNRVQIEVRGRPPALDH